KRPDQRLDVSVIASSIIAAAAARRFLSRSWSAARPRARRPFPAPRSPGEPSPDQTENDPTHDATSRFSTASALRPVDRAAWAQARRVRPGRADRATSPNASYRAPHDATGRRSHLASARVGLAHDRQLVLRAKPPKRTMLDELGVRAPPPARRARRTTNPARLRLPALLD